MEGTKGSYGRLSHVDRVCLGVLCSDGMTRLAVAYKRPLKEMLAHGMGSDGRQP